jgi:hypothetical protein
LLLIGYGTTVIRYDDEGVCIASAPSDLACRSHRNFRNFVDSGRFLNIRKTAEIVKNYETNAIAGRYTGD